MELLETVSIDESNRYGLYYDEFAENPLDSWDCWENLGVFTYRRARGLQEFSKDAGAHDLIAHWMGYDVDADLIVDRMNRHGWVATVYEMWGASPSDWIELILYTREEGVTRDDLRERLSEFRSWFRGDVYIVSREELVTYTNAERGATIDRWEVVDSVGECYLKEFTLESVREVL